MRFNPNLIHIENTFKVERKRIAILQGGSRSGKTYSALQWIIRTCMEYKGLTYSIVRKTLPALKASSMRTETEQLSSRHSQSLMQTNNINILKMFVLVR